MDLTMPSQLSPLSIFIFGNFLPKLMMTTVILIMFTGLWLVIKRLFKRSICHIPTAARPALHLLIKVIKTLISIIASICTLATWGIDIDSLIAGLGLTGVGIGFALKDVILSAISGIFVMIYKPFKLADTINIAGITGIVTAIDLRCITLEEGETIHLIPNAKLLIENISILKSAPEEE